MSQESTASLQISALFDDDSVTEKVLEADASVTSAKVRDVIEHLREDQVTELELDPEGSEEAEPEASEEAEPITRYEISEQVWQAFQKLPPAEQEKIPIYVDPNGQMWTTVNFTITTDDASLAGLESPASPDEMPPSEIDPNR